MSNFLQHKSHKALLETIKEYLEQQGYLQTLSVLDVIYIQTEKVPEQSSIFSSLLTCMEKGDGHCFFLIFSSLPEYPQQSEDLKSLEFYLRVYFAIHPCHQATGRQGSKESASRYLKNMEEFKDYLDSQGSHFSGSEEFLAYFALPYIPNPSEHPAFRHIFTTKWLNSLKEKLSMLIAKEPLCNPSILQLMYEKYIDNERPQNGLADKQLMSQIHSLENQLAIALEENNKIRLKFRKSEEKWEECTNEVIVVARDLFRVVESARTGKSVSEAMVASAFTALSKYDKSLKMASPDTATSVQLNFATVIKGLSTMQDDLQICALLQALRWRLTRTPRSVHKENLENFIRFNILCTVKPHDSLLDNLLSNTRRVKEYTIRFLNVITSEKSGRVYLLQKENIVVLLVGVLYSEKQDNLLRQNTLGVLQKLSLKRSAQLEMIKLEVLDWLLKVLKHESDGIADYTLEYATALLMNLSLRSLGKDKLSKNPNEVISLLNKLVAHDNNQVRTYINGTLYSILTRKALKEAALRHGIEKKLKSLRNKSEENIKRQINFILEQLKQQEDNECVTDDTEEEVEETVESGSEDEEAIGEDEDMDDLITAPSVVTGEALLRERFEGNCLLSAASSKREIEEHKESGKNNNDGAAGKKKEEALNKKKMTSKVAPAKDNAEMSNGFKSRDKIPRTPLQF